MKLVSAVKARAAEAGLDAVGVTTAGPFASTAVEIQRRKHLGTAGRLKFTFGSPTSTAIGRTHPWARSLVVGARSYVVDAGQPIVAARSGVVARFATIDHYDALRVGLAAAADELQSAGHRAEILVDDNGLVDRAAAVRAGIAWWGKSTMAIAPKFGPWLLLGSVLTDAALPPDQPMARDCGTCDACIPACPTGALDDVGRLDATRCIAYWLQTPGVIPFELRAAIGQRFYGCDECLVACPPGQRLESRGQPNADATVDVVTVLTEDPKSWFPRWAHFYVPRRDPAFLQRNALIVLGNVGNRSDAPIVAPYLTHARPEVRAHAVAALVALGFHTTDPLLAPAASDDHAWVQTELRRPLRAGKG